MGKLDQEIPTGATHFHEGNAEFVPHYLMVNKGDGVQTWVTGFVGGPHWSYLPAHAPLIQYVKLRQD